MAAIPNLWGLWKHALCQAPHTLRWTGFWVVFGRLTMVAIKVASVMVLGVVLFVLLYEEPTLRKMFGAEYDEYCRNVRRWVPWMRAWDR